MDFARIKAAFYKRHAGAEHWTDTAIKAAWEGLAPDTQAEYTKEASDAGIPEKRNAKGMVARTRGTEGDGASDAPVSLPDSAGVFGEV